MRRSVPLLHFRHYATYRKLRKKKFKKIRKFFFSIFSFLRAFVVSSCRKSGFRVFLSLRYDADLGRSRLVPSRLSKHSFVDMLQTTISVDKLKGVTSSLELDGSHEAEPAGMRDCFEKIYVLTTKG